jgi:hypothetical protein
LILLKKIYFSRSVVARVNVTQPAIAAWIDGGLRYRQSVSQFIAGHRRGFP